MHDFFSGGVTHRRTLSPIIRGHQHLITAGGGGGGAPKHHRRSEVFMVFQFSDYRMYTVTSCCIDDCLTEIPKRLAKKHMALFIPWGPGLEYM